MIDITIVNRERPEEKVELESDFILYVAEKDNGFLCGAKGTAIHDTVIVMLANLIDSSFAQMTGGNLDDYEYLLEEFSDGLNMVVDKRRKLLKGEEA